MQWYFIFVCEDWRRRGPLSLSFSLHLSGVVRCLPYYYPQIALLTRSHAPSNSTYIKLSCALPCNQADFRFHCRPILSQFFENLLWKMRLLEPARMPGIPKEIEITRAITRIIVEREYTK